MRELKFRAWTGNYMDNSDSLLGLSNFFEYAEDKGWEVMQYTGLKDKNGKEIYESDLLKDAQSGHVYQMGFEEGMFDILNYDNYSHDQYRAFDNFFGWEIVGNIYENPELIK